VEEYFISGNRLLGIWITISRRWWEMAIKIADFWICSKLEDQKVLNFHLSLFKHRCRCFRRSHRDRYRIVKTKRIVDIKSSLKKVSKV
jgi:hypothetical protein